MNFMIKNIVKENEHVPMDFKPTTNTAGFDNCGTVYSHTSYSVEME